MNNDKIMAIKKNRKTTMRSPIRIRWSIVTVLSTTMRQNLLAAARFELGPEDLKLYMETNKCKANVPERKTGVNLIKVYLSKQKIIYTLS